MADKKQKPMREAMPLTAAFIDACRAAFGVDAVDVSIRAGMAGLPGFFHASENGQTIGTPFPEATVYTCMSRDITPLVIAKRGRQ